ncbi:MAG: hypothetical protein R2812_09275 [Gelidibacter sp.]
MKTIQTKLIILLLLGTLSTSAQQKLQKIEQTINTTKDVTINLNTSHTNIVIDTWNKDNIEIEAYIEGEKLSKEELEKALNDWDITVSGSGSEVTIQSKGSKNSWEGYDLSSLDAMRDLKFEMAELPELPELPEMPELPELAQFPNAPQMPKMPELPELPQGIGAVNFDYEAYKKDGEAYLEKWSKDYETQYGKDFKDKMKAWGKKFGETDYEAYSKEMEKWGAAFGKKFGKDYEKKMEEWGKAFEENWGKDYQKKMEVWGERFEKQMEARQQAMQDRKAAMKNRETAMRDRQEAMRDRAEAIKERREAIERSIENKVNTKIKKTIKIKMPKKAKLNMNVRHGELKFASVITNLKADISHSALVANSIDGSQTSINVSYSPVLITNWIMGELKLNYVEKAQIETVNRLVLSSNSSNVSINDLTGNAVIDGSFGELDINKIAETFSNLNLVLENSEALLILPKTAFNLQYKGNRSKLKHPKNKTSTTSSFSTGDLMSGKTIVVNAKFSEVMMQ